MADSCGCGWCLEISHLTVNYPGIPGLGINFTPSEAIKYSSIRRIVTISIIRGVSTPGNAIFRDSSYQIIQLELSLPYQLTNLLRIAFLHALSPTHHDAVI